MEDMVQEFVSGISKRDVFQAKYLKRWDIREEERKELNCFLNFYVDVLHYKMDFIVESYLFVNQMVVEETYYFMTNGKYRYNSFEEVEKVVYGNPEYMEKYMTGVSISEYIWVPHMKMIRYFSKMLPNWKGNYLEIGPGGGQYLIKAIQSGRFCKFAACDVSKTSVDRSNKFLKYVLGDKKGEESCTVVQKNFFEYNVDEKYDCIVMGEVLEHVEEPLAMLKKIYDLLTDDGSAFVTTVINAPTIDHIYLFDTIESVIFMVSNAGFNVFDYICATAGNISLSKAIQKKLVIDIAMVLKKQ